MERCSSCNKGVPGWATLRKAMGGEVRWCKTNKRIHLRYTKRSETTVTVLWWSVRESMCWGMVRASTIFGKFLPPACIAKRGKKKSHTYTHTYIHVPIGISIKLVFNFWHSSRRYFCPLSLSLHISFVSKNKSIFKYYPRKYPVFQWNDLSGLI